MTLPTAARGSARLISRVRGVIPVASARWTLASRSLRAAGPLAAEPSGTQIPSKAMGEARDQGGASVAPEPARLTSFANGAVALFGTSADPPTMGHRALLLGLRRLYPLVATWASDNPLKHIGRAHV